MVKIDDNTGAGDGTPPPLSDGSARTLQEIKATLENAKMEQSDLQRDLTQVVSFGSNFSDTELRLLELNDDVLNSIKVGSRLVLRGGSEDSTALCTENSTYELKEADTTNSILVMNNLSFPESSPTKGGNMKRIIDVEDTGEGNKDSNYGEMELEEVQNRSILRVIHSYYELKKINPNLSLLQQILAPSSYKGQNNEPPEEMPPTFDMLLDKVAGSQQQIRSYLDQNMKCVEINGKIRVIDEKYLFEALNDVLQCIEDNSWERDKVPTESIVSQLDFKYIELILRNIMKWFFTEEAASSTAAPGDLLKMNEHEICRFIGSILVRANQKLCLKDFMKSWQQCVPNGLRVDIKQLSGIALCDTECSPSVIWYFPAETLPDSSVGERFMTLFQEKSKWREDEILPYIQSFVSPSQNASGLLTKYARGQTNGAVKVYSSKHVTK